MFAIVVIVSLDERHSAYNNSLLIGSFLHFTFHIVDTRVAEKSLISINATSIDTSVDNVDKEFARQRCRTSPRFANDNTRIVLADNSRRDRLGWPIARSSTISVNPRNSWNRAGRKSRVVTRRGHPVYKFYLPLNSALLPPPVVVHSSAPPTIDIDTLAIWTKPFSPRTSLQFRRSNPKRWTVLPSREAISLPFTAAF